MAKISNDWSDSEELPMDEATAQEVKARDDMRRKIAWRIISSTSVVLAIICATLFFGQRKKNKELVHENYKLWDESCSNSKDLKEAQNTISFLSGQRDQLVADLEKCSENCAPKPAPVSQPVVKKVAPQPKKPVAKPQPKPAPAPKPQPQSAPVVRGKPIVIRDTVRETVKIPVAQETPVAEPMPTGKKKIVYEKHMFVNMINVSADGYCAPFSVNNSSNNAESNTGADNSSATNEKPVAADTAMNRIVADTISKAR